MYGRSLHEARREMGRRLAREAPAEADLVIPIPDTGHSAAQGFAEVSGIVGSRAPRGGTGLDHRGGFPAGEG